MKTLQVQKKDASVLFFMFANLYKTPDIKLWEEISHEAYFTELEGLATNLVDSENMITIMDIPKTLNEMKHTYFHSICGGGKESNLLVESIYKVWTTDPNCGIPFARSKGYLLGDSALHIRFILEKFEMTVPEQFSNTPDHLVILLELLSYFIENAQEDFTLQFIEDHFDWIDSLVEKLNKPDSNQFYYQLTCLLRQTLHSFKHIYY